MEQNPEFYQRMQQHVAQQQQQQQQQQGRPQ
jgi:hypothetical protein